MSLRDFDPFGDGWGEISYETMAELRRSRPVAHTPSGLWYLSRYEDCRRALGDSGSFSNVGGLRAPGVVVPRDERMINEMDPPDHTRMRKLEQSVLNFGNFYIPNRVGLQHTAAGKRSLSGKRDIFVVIH